MVWGCVLLLFALVGDVVAWFDCGLVVIGCGLLCVAYWWLVGCCVTCA